MTDRQPTNDELVLPWQHIFLATYSVSADMGIDTDILQLALLSAAMEARLKTHPPAEAVAWAEEWIEHFRQQIMPGPVKH